MRARLDSARGKHRFDGAQVTGGGVLRQISATWIVIGIVIAAGLGIMLAISAGKPEITRE